MRKFEVEITEKLSRVIPVEAESEEEAEKTVREQYKLERIILDEEDISKTKFEVLRELSPCCNADLTEQGQCWECKEVVR